MSWEINYWILALTEGFKLVSGTDRVRGNQVGINTCWYPFFFTTLVSSLINLLNDVKLNSFFTFCSLLIKWLSVKSHPHQEFFPDEGNDRLCVAPSSQQYPRWKLRYPFLCLCWGKRSRNIYLVADEDAPYSDFLSGDSSSQKVNQPCSIRGV